MVHTFTNKQEIAGPLAALYLLRGSCCYSSDTCAQLPLGDAIKQLESSGEYLCTLIATNSEASTTSAYRPASFLDDYIYRPSSIRDMNLYEFTMRCYRRQRASTSAESHLFTRQHPLRTSHCLGQREAVLVIKGQRVLTLKDDMDDEDREKYAKLVLVLFKAFRTLDDLKVDTSGLPTSWFQHWEGERSQLALSIMRNMEDCQAGHEGEDEATFETGGVADGQSDVEGDSSSDDAYDSEDAGLFLDEDADNDNDNVLALITGMNVSDGVIQVFPARSVLPLRIQTILADFQRRGLVQGIAVGVAASYQRVAHLPSETPAFTVKHLKEWVKNAEFDLSARRGMDVDSIQGIATERRTTVSEILDEALEPRQLAWNPPQVVESVPAETPPFCGIAAVSRAFKLNELQHGAFAIVASHLLQRWRSLHVLPDAGYLISDSVLKKSQLLMYMGGEGGTGKSRVICAIQQFCRAWQRPGSTVVTALTGKAASIISGQTLAILEMTLKNPRGHVALQDVDCIIVDEVSMMSKDQLLRLDRLLRKAKRILDVPFGGMFVIVVGDFLQLPPVGADPLVVDPPTKTKVSLADFEGFSLWRQFRKVVILRETVRFQEDPEWGAGCSKARYGEWTPEFIDMINNRVIDNVRGAQSRIHVAPETVFVTPDNDTRTAINGQFVASTALLLPREEFPVRVIANFKGALNMLSHDDISEIFSLPDTKFGRMAPFLDLIRGMPIQITQNIRTKKGVANGTMGHLHSVHFPEDTAFSQVRDARSGVVVVLPNKRPLYALVRLSRCCDAIPIADDVDPSLFPVFPDCEAFQNTTIQLTKSSTGEPRTLTIKIQQFPFVCAVGATVYKVQGESMRSMAVVDWKGEVGQANRSQQADLMVSRVVKREDLVCMKRFTAQDAAWSTPPATAIEEEKRLAIESEQTLRLFYTSLSS